MASTAASVCTYAVVRPHAQRPHAHLGCVAAGAENFLRKQREPAAPQQAELGSDHAVVRTVCLYAEALTVHRVASFSRVGVFRRSLLSETVPLDFALEW